VNTKQILVDARSKLDKFENWTTKTSARNSIGEWSCPLARTACSWCSLGAIERATGGGRDPEYYAAVKKLSAHLPEPTPYLRSGPSVSYFNDLEATPEHHAKVLACFDAAIASS
jgi:hypothetical protein